ncbi:Cof-type HAD-IIB family hydrolase [Alkalihalobacillus sp. MEB130]|uniref:Cof-type HAD-IIB family hydrolase n=1 Tax=Alkalihalobacillus sp. MEB130 TaxID=2976704 RepID=UPI0028DF32E8|nr:Cof-type HAD-IIB family hydrolase [Alkalihalobacillus sp. MEB130]MDT8859921.1 Cof-type HAD-IIB family hydrolase [Alkalihalobacillus sp. MEB130]
MKVIAIDMDGTLLGNVHEVTAENAKAVKEAQQLGVNVVIATGRDEKEARSPLKQAGIICPTITVNGAQVRDEDGNVLSSYPLLKEKTRHVFDVLLTNDIYFELYTNHGTVTDNYDKAIQAIIDFFHAANPAQDINTMQQFAKERFETGAISLVASYDELLEQEDTEILKVLAFSKDEEKLSKTRAQLHDIDGLAVSASAPDNIEITHKQAQKGLAVTAFAERLGISMDEVMVIGDSFNDVSMFKVAGYKVAMGNAEQAIKDLADFISKSNDEDGVAFAIRQKLSHMSR